MSLCGAAAPMRQFHGAESLVSVHLINQERPPDAHMSQYMRLCQGQRARSRNPVDLSVHSPKPSLLKALNRCVVAELGSAK